MHFERAVALFFGAIASACAASGSEPPSAAPVRRPVAASSADAIPAMTEPIARATYAAPAPPDVADDPAQCASRPRPHRFATANPPLLIRASGRAAARPPPPEPRYELPTHPLEPRYLDFAGPNAWRGAMAMGYDASGRDCGPFDRGLVAAALEEADLRKCAVEGEPPCARLRLTIEPDGRISRVELGTGAELKSAQCVASIMRESMIRFTRPYCGSAVTASWTYYVDR